MFNKTVELSVILDAMMLRGRRYDKEHYGYHLLPEASHMPSIGFIYLCI